MYKIIVCDDETKILNKLISSIDREFKNANFPISVAGFDKSEALINAFDTEEIDVLFLDIDMPFFNGLDIAKFITERKLNILIIFVTSHDALVYETFTYRPFGFIRKSHFDTEISQVVTRIKDELLSRNEKLVLKNNNGIFTYNQNDILYIESEANYVNIYTKDGVEKYRETLTNLETKLLSDIFIRCHKGYLVNSNHISRMSQNELLLSNASTIPIGRSYEKYVKQKLIRK